MAGADFRLPLMAGRVAAQHCARGVVRRAARPAASTSTYQRQRARELTPRRATTQLAMALQGHGPNAAANRRHARGRTGSAVRAETNLGERDECKNWKYDVRVQATRGSLLRIN